LKASEKGRRAYKAFEKTMSLRISRELYSMVQAGEVLAYHFSLSGIRTSVGLAMQLTSLNKQRGHPDLIVYTRLGVLMFELKTKSPFKKDGTLKKDSHLEEQEAYMGLLRRSDGIIHADFATSAEDVIKKVKEHI
jgi:hypothetical protein